MPLLSWFESYECVFVWCFSARLQKTNLARERHQAHLEDKYISRATVTYFGVDYPPFSTFEYLPNKI